MNLMITPNFTQPNIQNNNNKVIKFNIFARPAQNQNLPANSNLAPLARDTVSFGAGLRSDKVIKGNPFIPKINVENLLKNIPEIKLLGEEDVKKLISLIENEKISDQAELLQRMPNLKKMFPDALERLVSGLQIPKNIFNMKMASEIVKDATDPAVYLSSVLNRYLGGLISTSGQDRPIQYIGKRIKDPKELFKKAMNIATKKGLEITSKQDVKTMVEDIIGSRIVLRDASPANMKKIFKALLAAVEAGALKISQVENYYPVIEGFDKKTGAISHSSFDFVGKLRRDLGINLSEKQLREMGKKDYFAYASDRDMNAFVSELRKYGDVDFNPEGIHLPSGYPAIHLRVELPNGYRGEIQIMGRDVEYFKDFEDVYYKAKCGKLEKEDYPETYKRLAPIFPLKEDASEYDKREWDIVQDALQEHTFFTYIGQKIKGTKEFREKISPRLLEANEFLKKRGLGFNQMMPVIKADRKNVKTSKAQKAAAKKAAKAEKANKTSKTSKAE